MNTTAHPAHFFNPSLRRDLFASVLTGQIAGLIMALAMVLVFSLFLGTTPWFPVQVIGSFALGDQALVGFNFPAVLAGLVLHQAGPTLFWSIIFGLAMNQLDLRGVNLLALGLGVGACSQLVDVDLLLPPLMTALHGHNLWAEHVPNFWSWAAHLVYGASLALYPTIRERLN